MRPSQRSVEREQFWRRVLQEQPSSGLTIQAFCEQEGVSDASFYAWRRRLAKRESRSRGDDEEPPRLVPVTVVPPGANGGRPRDDSLIEIVTPDGFKLRVDRSVAPADIGELLRVVLASRSEATRC